MKPTALRGHGRMSTREETLRSHLSRTTTSLQLHFQRLPEERRAVGERVLSFSGVRIHFIRNLGGGACYPLEGTFGVPAACFPVHLRVEPSISSRL